MQPPVLPRHQELLLSPGICCDAFCLQREPFYSMSVDDVLAVLRIVLTFELLNGLAFFSVQNFDSEFPLHA